MKIIFGWTNPLSSQVGTPRRIWRQHIPPLPFVSYATPNCVLNTTLHYVLKSISTSTILVDLDLPVPVCELQRGSWPAVPWWSLPAHPEAAEVSPVPVLVYVGCPEPSAAESAAVAVPPAPVSDLHPETETRTISHILILKYSSLKTSGELIAMYELL